MNYQEVFKKHDVNIRKIVIANPKYFFSLPYVMTKDVITESEQLKYLTDEGIRFERYKFFENIMKHPNKNDISANLFITHILHFDSWQNHITDIINFIDGHAEEKQMLMMLINNFGKNENLVHNIADNLVTKFNLKIKLFDADVYDRIAANNFALFDGETFDYLTKEVENGEANFELFKKTAFPYIKSHVEKIRLNQEKTWALYCVPEQLIGMLTKENILSIFEIKVKDDEFDSKFFADVFEWFARKNKLIDEEFAIEISNQFELKLPPCLLSKEKVKDHLTETIEYEVDYDNPFKHIDDCTWNELRKTKHKDEIIKQALRLDSILKNPKNIYSLELFEPNVGCYPKGLIKEIFEKHYDYIEMGLDLRSFSHNFIHRLFKEYLRSAEGFDAKKLAYDRFMSLHTNRSVIVETLGDKNIRCPEYLDFLLTDKKGYGLMLVAELVENEQEEVINLL